MRTSTCSKHDHSDTLAPIFVFKSDMMINFTLRSDPRKHVCELQIGEQLLVEIPGMSHAFGSISPLNEP